MFSYRSLPGRWRHFGDRANNQCSVASFLMCTVKFIHMFYPLSEVFICSVMYNESTGDLPLVDFRQLCYVFRLWMVDHKSQSCCSHSCILSCINSCIKLSVDKGRKTFLKLHVSVTQVPHMKETSNCSLYSLVLIIPVVSCTRLLLLWSFLAYLCIRLALHLKNGS